MEGKGGKLRRGGGRGLEKRGVERVEEGEIT